MVCKKCGKELREGAKFCTGCGMVVVETKKDTSQQTVKISNTNNTLSSILNVSAIISNGEKNKNIAGILALILGGLGIHKFYMGNTKMGVIYLLFCWTCIPSIVSFVEGLMYLCETDIKFKSRCS